MNALARRSSDRYPTEARATYAPDSVTNRCVLVSPHGAQRKSLKSLGWSELQEHGGCVLLQAPAGFRFAGASA
jgi:hypothetical protein